MNCEICHQQASFICNCTNVFLCLNHIGQHLICPGKHQYNKLFENLEPFENSILEKELNQRISSLKLLKKQLTHQAELFIQQIKNHYNSSIQNISKILKNYKKLFNQTEFPSSEINKIRELMKTEMIINQFDSTKILEEIKKNYQNLIIIKKDLSKENSFNYKKFLKTHNGGFSCLVISGDGNILLTGSEDSTVRIWDLEKMKQISCYSEHKSEVVCLALSKDELSALSGSFDRKVICWDLENNRVKRIFEGHSGIVCCVCYSIDQKSIISGSSMKEIFIWKKESSIPFRKISTKYEIRAGILFYEDVFILGADKVLEFWNLSSYESCYSITAHEKKIWCITTTKSHQFIITCSEDKFVKIWETSSMFLHSSHTLHSNEVLSVSTTSNDENILSGSIDKSLILWNIKSKSLIHKFTYHKDCIFGVTSLNDQLISISRDGNIGISKISSKQFKTFLTLKPFNKTFKILKQNFITCGSLNDVLVWNADDEENNIILQGHSNLVYSARFSSNNDFLISTSIGSKNNVIVWDFKRKSKLALLTGHEKSVFCVDISFDDLNAISGDADGKIIYWDLSEFKDIFVFIGHSSRVYSVKFTNDKKFAASGGEDRFVIVWNLMEKVMHARLEGHSKVVWKVLITRDDKYFVSADNFDGIRIWNIDMKRNSFHFRNLEEAKIWLDVYQEIKGEMMDYLV